MRTMDALIWTISTFGFVKRLNVPVNNFSVISGQSHRFLGITSTFRGVTVSYRSVQSLQTHIRLLLRPGEQSDQDFPSASFEHKTIQYDHFLFKYRVITASFYAVPKFRKTTVNNA